MNPQGLASQLLAVRDGAGLIEDLPADERPRDATQGYEVADLVVAALGLRLGPIAGYKVGATSVAGQQLLGLSEPFYGRTFGRCIVTDSQGWPFGDAACTLEPEVGFVLAQDLPPRLARYSLAEVRCAISAVVALLEVNRPSYAKPFQIGAPALIADNGVTQGFIVSSGSRTFDAATDLAAETVNMSLNGESCATGRGDAVLGNPLNALWWLANKLCEQGRGLKRGQVIASGALATHTRVALGDLVVARFSGLGELKVRVGGQR